MKFNGNLAWQQAIAAVGAHRDVLFAVAGVFFLLPALVTGFFLSDVQAMMLANAQAVPPAAATKFFLIAFGAGLVQAVGTMTLLALLTDRQRPTVGEAIGIGLRAIPTVIAAGVLLMIALMLATVPISLLAGLMAAAAGPAAVVVVIAMLVGFAYVMTKLSLLMPVIVIERTFNPVAALLRSWRLTKGNSVRLFFFYLLLLIAYLVIAIVFGLVFSLFVGGGMAAMQGAGAQAGAGAGATLAMSLVSGVLGTLASVILTAILAAIHHQLSGPSPDAVSATFE